MGALSGAESSRLGDCAAGNHWKRLTFSQRGAYKAEENVQEQTLLTAAEATAGGDHRGATQ